jgi:GGDEF domain-containing protein
VASE